MSQPKTLSEWAAHLGHPNANNNTTRGNTGQEAGEADASRTDTTQGQEYTDTADRHTGMEGSGDRTLIGDTHSKRYNDATGFISEGAVEAREMDRSNEEESMMMNLHPVSEQHHSIERILSRPVKIATIRYDSTKAAGAIIGSYDILNTFRRSTAFKLAREKLSSFYGVKWTAHFKVTVNAQPFESGIFQLFFIPFYLVSDNVVDPNTETALEPMLPFTTGCPSIPCNIAQQSEVELAVPYTGPAAFINLTNSNADYGTYFVQAITPIADSTNAPSCELSVYMYFTDIKLFGTSPNTKIDPCVSPQMMKQPSEREEAGAKESGPLTQVANTLLPILNLLGLSSPGANPNPKRMTINPYAMNSTADTTKVPQKLAYTFDHHLALGTLGVDNVDEMAIKTIITKPTYYNQFSWAVADDFGKRLMTYPVEPNGVLVSNLPDGQTGQLLAPTRLRFVANVFKYWRGSIKYHFSIAANKFHSGRLRFVYTLGGPPSDTQDYQNLLPRSFTQIVDIRDASHFEVVVPYFSSASWRTVPQDWDPTTNTYTSGDELGPLDDDAAYLSVYVENELRASPTTNQSVQIVCYVSAGDDFQFATPIAPPFYPHIRPSDNRNFVMPQGYDYAPINMVSGKDSIPEKETKPHKFTVGETVMNVRALIKRYQLIGTAQLNFSDAAPKNFLVMPFYFQQPSTETSYMYDMLSYFRPLYKFYRGSIRHMITSSDPNTHFAVRYDPDFRNIVDTETSAFGTRSGYLNVTNFNNTGDFDGRPMTATVPYFTPLQGGMEAEYPYYSRFHKLFMSYDNPDAESELAQYYQDIVDDLVPAGIGFMQITSLNNRSINTPFRFFRAAADDFSMGYLLGAPFVRANVVRQN